MNPFELRGPQFLVFYLAFAAAVILALHWIQRRLWSRQPEGGRLSLTDPYEIAYLRGGGNEAVRIAVISLIERGLLEVQNKIELVAAPEARRLTVNDPLEQALLRFFHIRKQAADAFKLGKEIWENALFQRRAALERAGLLADEPRRGLRKQLAAAGAVVLLSVAATKIWIALAAGRRNVWFLVFLTFVAICFELAVLWRARRTPLGDAALADLKQLFDARQGQAARSSEGELILLAAVFGIVALPMSAMPYVPELYPRAYRDPGGSSGGGCGSGCGSSCGGGGGCGGGGCGGCGS